MPRKLTVGIAIALLTFGSCSKQEVIMSSTKNEAQEERHLKERYLQLQKVDQAEPVRTALTKKVVKWRSATQDMYSPEPFYRQRFRGGRWANSGEELPESVEHGLDEQGNVIVIRDYYPTYFRRDGEFIEVVRFHSQDPRAIILEHYYLENGRVARHLIAREESFGKTTFHWENEKLVRSVEQICHLKFLRAADPLAMPLEWSDYGQRTYDYDPDGELNRITLTGVAPQPEIEYRRAAPGETAAALAGELEDRLVKLIPQAVHSANIDEPLYCVFLCYCSSGWNLPPDLCLAKEKERDADDPDVEMIWNPAELKDAIHIDLTDDDLRKRWQLFYQLMSEEEDFQTYVAMMRRVALRLNALQTDSTYPRTDDFIFTACDVCDGVRFNEDRRESISPERLQLLKERGFWD